MTSLQFSTNLASAGLVIDLEERSCEYSRDYSYVKPRQTLIFLWKCYGIHPVVMRVSRKSPTVD
jgi:hypothetical protein